MELTRALGHEIRARRRERLTAHHVPRVVVAVPDFPRTQNGTLSELAARDAVHGRPVKHTGALANPEALAHVRDRAELRAPYPLAVGVAELASTGAPSPAAGATRPDVFR